LKVLVYQIEKEDREEEILGVNSSFEFCGQKRDIYHKFSPFEAEEKRTLHINIIIFDIFSLVPTPHVPFYRKKTVFDSVPSPTRWILNLPAQVAWAESTPTMAWTLTILLPLWSMSATTLSVML